MEIENIYQQSYANEEQIRHSTQCGCFFCESLFDSATVIDFCQEDGDKRTALCPHCGMDTVIGDSTGISITPELLHQLNQQYF